ncbi:hypothetical protein KIN20_025028 [Parelaphostrongylus tenuis]|uniref:Uncharacterized protein n=1 Tax=Parelaphostrongylus tenuis TaxID=148309 RepID=A0AAD5NAF8_PARTN|nr:hypothetical protein KIN20_025028 [Parelaphostrongylus tenuis]
MTSRKNLKANSLIQTSCLAERDAELAGADGAILPPMKSRSKNMHHQEKLAS